jgi:hypothetical protein
MKLESTTCSCVVIAYYQLYQQTDQVFTETEVNIGVVIVGSWRVKANLLKLKSSKYKITGRTPFLRILLFVLTEKFSSEVDRVFTYTLFIKCYITMYNLTF